MRKIAIVFFTAKAAALGRRICTLLQSDQVSLYSTKTELCETEEEIHLITEGLQNWCGQCFAQVDAILFIGAAGIAVRTIAPFVQSKVSDPAVLVADELGHHVVSLLSGHLGGGNELTLDIAHAIAADPVITTASDVNGKTAVDVWARQNGLLITDLKMAKRVAAEIVAGKQIPIYCDSNVEGAIPKEFVRVADPKKLEEADLGIAVSIYHTWGKQVLHLIPRCVVMGIGCKKERAYEGIRTHVYRVLKQYDVDERSICRMCSVDLKAEESGLLQLASELAIPFETYTAEALMQVPGTYAGSEFVKQTTGVDCVCERAAVAGALCETEETMVTSDEMNLSSGDRRSADVPDLLVRKTAQDGVTMALCMVKKNLK